MDRVLKPIGLSSSVAGNSFHRGQKDKCRLHRRCQGGSGAPSRLPSPGVGPGQDCGRPLLIQDLLSAMRHESRRLPVARTAPSKRISATRWSGRQVSQNWRRKTPAPVRSRFPGVRTPSILLRSIMPPTNPRCLTSRMPTGTAASTDTAAPRTRSIKRIQCEGQGFTQIDAESHAAHGPVEQHENRHHQRDCRHATAEYEGRPPPSSKPDRRRRLNKAGAGACAIVASAASGANLDQENQEGD